MKKITPQNDKQNGVTSTPTPKKFAEIVARLFPDPAPAHTCDCPMCECRNSVSTPRDVCSSCRNGQHAN